MVLVTLHGSLNFTAMICHVVSPDHERVVSIRTPAPQQNYRDVLDLDSGKLQSTETSIK